MIGSCGEGKPAANAARLMFSCLAIHQTLASSATLPISRWALAGGFPTKPTHSARRVLPPLRPFGPTLPEGRVKDAAPQERRPPDVLRPPMSVSANGSARASSAMVEPLARRPLW